MDNIQTENKSVRPSKKLFDLINDWADAYVLTNQLPLKILEAARQEGFSNEQIRREIESALRVRHVSERTIRRNMPRELRRQYIANRKPVEHKHIGHRGQITKVEFSNEDLKRATIATVEIKNDQEAEMEAIAQKLEPEAPTMTKEDPDINTVTFKLSISSGKEYFKEQIIKFGDYIVKDIPSLRNRGWRWVEVTIKVTN